MPPRLPSRTTTTSVVARRKITQARVARLATLDANGRPHIVPICFVFDGSAFYTALDEKPKRVAPERLARLRNIRAQSRVALLIDEYKENWSQLWYALIRGKAKLLPSSARVERARAILRLRRKYRQYARGMLTDAAPVIRIEPERITTWGKI
jgi:PPOX class probable F420-dependent enzyme